MLPQNTFQPGRWNESPSWLPHVLHKRNNLWHDAPGIQLMPRRDQSKETENSSLLTHLYEIFFHEFVCWNSITPKYIFNHIYLFEFGIWNHCWEALSSYKWSYKQLSCFGNANQVLKFTDLVTSNTAFSHLCWFKHRSPPPPPKEVHQKHLSLNCRAQTVSIPVNVTDARSMFFCIFWLVMNEILLFRTNQLNYLRFNRLLNYRTITHHEIPNLLFVRFIFWNQS